MTPRSPCKTSSSTPVPNPPPGWFRTARDEAFIHKYYAFISWREALDFVELVSFLGERAGLLPGIVVCGSRVAVQVDAKEIEFARSLDPS